MPSFLFLFSILLAFLILSLFLYSKFFQMRSFFGEKKQETPSSSSSTFLILSFTDFSFLFVSPATTWLSFRTKLMTLTWCLVTGRWNKDKNEEETGYFFHTYAKTHQKLLHNSRRCTFLHSLSLEKNSFSPSRFHSSHIQNLRHEKSWRVDVT